MKNAPYPRRRYKVLPHPDLAKLRQNPPRFQNLPLVRAISRWWDRIVSLSRTFVWCGPLGFAVNGPSSFARYDAEGSEYGPYTLWFERKLGPLYWAATAPTRRFGIEML